MSVSVCVCLSSGYNIFQISIASNHKDNSLDFLTCGMAGGEQRKLFHQIFSGILCVLAQISAHVIYVLGKSGELTNYRDGVNYC